MGEVVVLSSLLVLEGYFLQVFLVEGQQVYQVANVFLPRPQRLQVVLLGQFVIKPGVLLQLLLGLPPLVFWRLFPLDNLLVMALQEFDVPHAVVLGEGLFG